MSKVRLSKEHERRFRERVLVWMTSFWEDEPFLITDWLWTIRREKVKILKEMCPDTSIEITDDETFKQTVIVRRIENG